jgi:hypothetical protein
MQAEYWKKLEKCLSSERLQVYGQDGVDHREIAARYLWNIAVSESLYAPLHLLEVGLRNAIDQAMVAETGSQTWYDNVALTPWGLREVGKAKANIANADRPVTPGRVIAELQFGFWTAMFESHFEQPNARFLPKGIKATFPHMPKSLHRRKTIKGDLDKIRKLRNRIFHHERIIHWKDLTQQHGLILDFLGWLNHDLAEMAKIIETFPKIYASGTQPFLDRLDGHIAAMAGPSVAPAQISTPDAPKNDPPASAVLTAPQK